MKIKSLLVGMLACTAMVSCTNDDVLENNNVVNQAGEKSYVAVNIVTPNSISGRAAEDFLPGSSDEITVNGAVFLFLNGEFGGCATPCYVSGDELKAWSNVTDDGKDVISSPVLVIENEKQVPSYIVAILNPVGGENHGYNETTSLEDLKDETATYASIQDGFVMTNSVYVDQNGKQIFATPISIENIKGDSDKALENAVTIPVERIVAKVNVYNQDKAAAAWKVSRETNAGQTIEIENNQTKTLSLNILGWEVLQNKESHTIKNIKQTAQWAFNWANWSDYTKQRSYWADDYDLGGRTEYKPSAMNSLAAKYVEETVNQNTTDIERTQNPYLIIKGQFVDENNEAVSLVEWKGQKYTEEGYLNLIAGNANVAKYWYLESENNGVKKYATFDSSFLTLQKNYQGTDWKAIAILSEECPAEFYTESFDANGNFVATDNNKVDASVVAKEVEKFGEVQYWNTGYTYFYTPIQHSIIEDVNDNVFNGVVRNHYYDIKINSIVGFGTPISNPDFAIDKPEDPTGSETYLAAEVVILEWKVVNNSVDLGE